MSRRDHGADTDAEYLLKSRYNLSICIEAAVAVLSTRSLEAPPSDARLVADACLKAAAELGFSKEELGEIVGRHRTSLERSGLEPSSKEGQLGLLFLRVVRSLDALMGADVELMRHWIEQPNAHLAGQCPRMLLFSVEGLGRLAAYLDALRG